jgi:hypothetical protein
MTIVIIKHSHSLHQTDPFIRDHRDLYVQNLGLCWEPSLQIGNQIFQFHFEPTLMNDYALTSQSRDPGKAQISQDPAISLVVIIGGLCNHVLIVDK